ncbi:hypothetical protein AM593_08108, partial [Mytilus galloprovincialis]
SRLPSAAQNVIRKPDVKRENASVKANTKATELDLAKRSKTSKCKSKCHKKARCIKGKCVCKGKYKGDGVRSCKKGKRSAYIGCYQDDRKRILSNTVLKDKRMTVQKCQQFCGQKGFKYSGVE